MMKNLIFNVGFVFLFLVSCTSTQIYTETAPSWVNDIRSGNGRLRVNVGNRIFYRSNYKVSQKMDREKVCDLAILQNKEFIQQSYPSVDIHSIPMVVELKYYDPVLNDCSTSISISEDFKPSNKVNVIGIHGKDTGILDLRIFPNNNLQIFVDDVIQEAQTSVKIGIHEGKHRLKIIHPKYEDFEQKFEIKSGKSKKLNVLLKPYEINGIIKTENVQSLIYVNGKYVGKGYIRYKFQLDKDYEIKFVHPEMENKVIIISKDSLTKSDEGKEIKYSLVQKPSLYTFITEPTNAKVYVDKKFIGKTPIKNKSLVIGSYQIKFEKKGYQTATKEIKVIGGKNSIVSKTLLKEKSFKQSSDYPYSGMVSSFAGYTLNVLALPVKIGEDLGNAFLGNEEFEGVEKQLTEPTNDKVGYYLVNLLLCMPIRVTYDTLRTAFGWVNYDIFEGM